MEAWFSNRLFIKGPSSSISELKKLAAGDLHSSLRLSINLSIKFFIAGCAGILRPTREMHYTPYPDLVGHGIGIDCESNRAFTDWIGLLIQNKDLLVIATKSILDLYARSGLSKVAWSSLFESDRAIIGHLLDQKRQDWFDNEEGFQHSSTHEGLWRRLDADDPGDLPFDMRLLIPTRLASEINGFNGGLLDGIMDTRCLYLDRHGIKVPVGRNVEVSTDGEKSLKVEFDTVESPPSPRVFTMLARASHCNVVHRFSQFDSPNITTNEYAPYPLSDLWD